MLRIITAAILASSISTPSISAPVELLTNGGFETGDFTGWTASIFPNSNGDVQVVSGNTAPVSGETVTGPSEGQFHALTGQEGPGAYSITQSFTVPAEVASLSLSFDAFAVSDATFVAGDLDPNGMVATQHARVDILPAGADPFVTGISVAASLLQPFIDGGFATAAYTSYAFDLLEFGLVEGQTYSVRFAQADNQGFLTLGVDDVSLIADTGVAAVPLPASLPLLLGGLAGIAATARRL